MQQLVQNLKNGKMKVLNVPYPILKEGSVLVRNHYSVISAGTESRTVRDARASMIQKAQSRPDQVEKVIQSVKSNGLVSTYKIVSDKLDSWSPLGYSSAGQVIDVGKGVDDIQINDYVACGGNTAVHAEVVCVSRKLLVKTKKDKLKESAFTTLGAIALQGVRQAQVQVGETVVVIGLGLMGILTVMCLKTAGVKVIAIDKLLSRVKFAEKIGADRALTLDHTHLSNEVDRYTRSIGCDAVIITASTQSTDPVNLAGMLCRKKAKVIIVGNVPTGFDRANYYKKELDLRMSCSYGPGRYDKQYEQKNIDYPAGYVRWTENRNMQAFIDFLLDDQIDIKPLIGNEIQLDQAKDGYDLLLKGTSPNNAILFSYDTVKSLSPKTIVSHTTSATKVPSIGLIGAGSFARNYVLPNLSQKCQLRGLVTASPHNARTVAEKYGFAYCSNDENDIFKDPLIDTVFILTQHHLHASLVIKSLQTNKNVFVEKPLCMNEIQLDKIYKVYQNSNKYCLVGYNRRFAPLIKRIKNNLPTRHPKAIQYRINAGPIAHDSWVQDLKTGGGRIIGEMCHFVDLICFLTQSRVKTLYASALDNKTKRADTLCVTLTFEDGSTANLGYFSNGNNKCKKEYLEIYCCGEIHILKDFYHYIHYSNKKRSKRLLSSEKGHKQELEGFINCIKNGATPCIPFEEIIHSSQITFNITESLKMHTSISFDTKRK